MSNLKENKVLYIVLSLLIATSLWLYVVTEVNTDADDTVNNIPISIVGSDILESRNLMITKQSVDDMDIDLEGNRNSLVRLNRENITVTADVAGITRPGEYDLRCNVTIPNTVMSGTVTVVNRENYYVKITVEEKIRKTIGVRGEFSGSIADGYQAGEMVLSPSELEITGPASLINTVDYAKVTLNAANLKESYSDSVPFALISREGTEIKGQGIELSEKTIHVVYPVFMVKDVDLAVKIIPGSGATEEDAQYTITPEKIRISGAERDVSAVTEIILGEVDLSGVGIAKNYIFPIELPRGLTNESKTTQAIVSVKISGLITKSIETDRIELAHVPEGFAAESVTQTVSVIVRGRAGNLAGVTGENLKIVADLSEIGKAEGAFRVPAKVIFEGVSNIGVVSEEHYISVNLTKSK